MLSCKTTVDPSGEHFCGGSSAILADIVGKLSFGFGYQHHYLSFFFFLFFFSFLPRDSVHKSP